MKVINAPGECKDHLSDHLFGVPDLERLAGRDF